MARVKVQTLRPNLYRPALKYAFLNSLILNSLFRNLYAPLVPLLVLGLPLMVCKGISKINTFACQRRTDCASLQCCTPIGWLGSMGC